MTGDDHVLARDLAAQAGTRLLELRAQGGDPDVLRKSGDRLSHEFLTAALADARPGDVVLSEEGADNPARLTARRVWIVDPLDGTREFGEPGRTDWAVHVALWESGALLAPGGTTLPALPPAAAGPSPPAVRPGCRTARIRCSTGPCSAAGTGHRRRPARMPRRRAGAGGRGWCG
jgi:3'(2'), 5'-bisphosphate nucleotidase